MGSIFNRLLGKGKQGSEAGTDEAMLALERATQSLRLELAERDREVDRLQAELARQRSGEKERIAGAVQAREEQLFADAAAPVAQLLTQAHLLEAEEKPVGAGDVLAVARRLVRVLAENGLTVEGDIGARVAFDPNRHESLGEHSPLPGEGVRVKLVGISYQGKVLRRAGVARE